MTMNRKRNSSLAAVLLACTLATIPADASAAAAYRVFGQDANQARIQDGGEIAPYYALISSIHGACYIENGKIYVSGIVSSLGAKATYAKVTLTLQKNSGSGFKNHVSWSATGTSSATKMTSYIPSAGVLYRLKITGTVTYGSTTETDTIYTNSVAL